MCFSFLFFSFFFFFFFLGLPCFLLVVMKGTNKKRRKGVVYIEEPKMGSQSKTLHSLPPPSSLILLRSCILYILLTAFSNDCNQIRGMTLRELLVCTKNRISRILRTHPTTEPPLTTTTITTTSLKTTSKVILQDTMKPTSVRLATHYKPSIKFVGTRHPVIPKSTIGGKLKPHPCSPSGVLPGTADCVPVQEFLKKQLPFVVKPYVAAVQPIKGPYSFVSRPLEPNEVDSVFKLPPEYQFKPIEMDECEVINSGGAL